MRNSLWICNILSLFSVFFSFSEPIFSMKVGYSYWALNSTSNDIVILFFQWILVLEKEWWKTRDCFWICCISSFFSLFSPFYESICFIVILYSYRALNSLSNDVFNKFFQWVLILKITRQELGIVFEYETFYLCFLFSLHFLNRFSPWKLHILVEHWILFRMMYSTSFSSGF